MIPVVGTYLPCPQPIQYLEKKKSQNERGLNHANCYRYQ